MKMKGLTIALVVAATIGVIGTGCAKQSAPASTPAPQQQTPSTQAKVDATASASFTADSTVFLKNASKDGKRVFGITKDMTLTNALVIEGTFSEKDDKDPNKTINDRSMALEARDKNNKPIANFTLTAPSITIASEGLVVEGGVIKGDVYVQAPGFNLLRAKVDGNIYFASAEIQKSFKMDAASTVTGKQEIKK